MKAKKQMACPPRRPRRPSAVLRKASLAQLDIEFLIRSSSASACRLIKGTAAVVVVVRTSLELAA